MQPRFNTEVANLGGHDKFEHVEFEPLVLTDSVGSRHEFHFRTHLYGNTFALDAFELRDGSPAGYQFQVAADTEDDRLPLFGRLIEKIRRALAIKHVEEGESGLRIADHQIVRGRIDWDEASDGRAQLLVRMGMSFEGWQFKLEIREQSEDI